MTPHQPRIAVLLPAYNAEAFIHRALASLNANTEPHDIVIVDDASKKPLKDILPPQSNLIILRNEHNLGITASLNIGLAYILEKNYAYLARLDADDVAAPERLAQQRAYLDEHPTIVMVGSWVRVVDGKGAVLYYLNHPIHHETIIKKLFYNTSFIHPALMIRIKTLREVGSYDMRYAHAAQDYDMVRRIAKHGRVANLPAYLLDYAMTPGTISQRKRGLQLINRLRIQWMFRDWTTCHFYLGLIKTMLLICIPSKCVMAMKLLKKDHKIQAIFVDQTATKEISNTSGTPQIMPDTTPRLLSQQPRIAVLIPAYNAEKTIKRSLASLNANAEPHDIIIVDDGSHVPLKTVVEPQPNLVILEAGYNIGITKALNFGLNYIQNKGYEFVARFDADDFMTPDRLAKQCAFMDANPDIALAGSWARIISEEGQTLYFLNHPTDHKTIMQKQFYASCFVHPSLMIRTQAFKDYGGYKDAYPSCEDYELTRHFGRHAKLANIPEYLIDYTMSSTGISQTKRRQQVLSRLKTQWDYRDWGNIHFYRGIAKTIILLFMPVSLITAIKQHIRTYQKTNSVGG